MNTQCELYGSLACHLVLDILSDALALLLHLCGSLMSRSRHLYNVVTPVWAPVRLQHLVNPWTSIPGLQLLTSTAAQRCRAQSPRAPAYSSTCNKASACLPKYCPVPGVPQTPRSSSPHQEIRPTKSAKSPFLGHPTDSLIDYLS